MTHVYVDEDYLIELWRSKGYPSRMELSEEDIKRIFGESVQ